MDTELWRVLMAAVKSADRRIPRTGRRPRYSDALIAKLYLWTAWLDRPLCWACDPQHYSGIFRPRQLPSVSQFTRRVKSPRVNALLHAVQEYLTRVPQPEPLAFLDGKPLPVSFCSCDPDARIGWATRGFAKGYKLHACATHDGRIAAFVVRPLNEGEAKVARTLLPPVPEAKLILADANYDTRHLYEALGARGQQLLTPLKRIAVRPESLQRMGPHRRVAVSLYQHLGAGYRVLLEPRAEIERILAALTCFGGGLTTLPPWVRGLDRVSRWVNAKIAIYHARLRLRKLAQ
jgi:hypothetical protein